MGNGQPSTNLDTTIPPSPPPQKAVDGSLHQFLQEIFIKFDHHVFKTLLMEINQGAKTFLPYFTKEGKRSMI